MENTANPIGVAQIDSIKGYIQDVVDQWVANNPDTVSWWKKILEKGVGLTTKWYEAVKYLIEATDYFINIVEDMVEGGPDKKATVLAAISSVYDSIVPMLLPVWIRPWNFKIKSFLINVVISLSIDFFVTKYREGNWTMEKEKKQFNFYGG